LKQMLSASQRIFIAGAGILRTISAPSVGPALRQRTIASTRGLGQQVDRLLDEDRDRR